MSPEFWATVKLISQLVGYSERKTNLVKVPSIEIIQKKFKENSIDYSYLDNTVLGKQVLDYLTYRADVLNNSIRLSLMNKNEAENEFTKLFNLHNPTCHLPKNKQKEEKKNYAFLTCIVNMLIEQSLQGKDCCYDPRTLPIFIKDNKPLMVMSRRCDGAFPSTVNPTVIWEIKEYYYTTTFGSRVADGIYETILDGTELNRIKNLEFNVQHLLIIDDYRTWWTSGKSYLCRLIDILHEGYLDELIVGKETLTRIPELVNNW